MDRKSMMLGALLAAGALPAPGSALAAIGGTAGGEVTVRVTPERQTLAKSDNVVVNVTVTNTGAVTQYLLKWQTPLGAIEAPLFEVTRDGLPVRYLGVQIKRAAPTAADYVVLKPGASLSRKIELSALYDMAITGAYSVRWRDGATQLFNRPGALRLKGGAAMPERATALPDQAASVWIDGRLPRGALDDAGTGAPPPGAGLTFSRCSNAQQETLGGAVQAAQAMAHDADLYLQAKTLPHATPAGSAPSTPRARARWGATSRRSRKPSPASR